MFQLEILNKAQLEWIESAEFYEYKEEGLVEKFIIEIEKILVLIQKNPLLFKVSKKEFRDAKVSIFPFLIIYKIDYEKNVVVIISIFHCKRNPKQKYKHI